MKTNQQVYAEYKSRQQRMAEVSATMGRTAEQTAMHQQALTEWYIEAIERLRRF